MELDPGNGSGSSGPGLLIEGFDLHTPSGHTVTGQAETLGSSIGDIENFDSRVTTTHNTATEGLAGIIAEDLADAPATARNQAREVVQGTTVAAGALTVYGTAITTYNNDVNRWNTTIGTHETAEEQREAKGQLTPQYNTAVEDLETAARTCKKHLEDPLNPTYIKTLYRAGALPSETPAIFGNLDLELAPEDKYEHYQAKIDAGEMPDFGDMTEAERLEFVENNPDLLPYLMSIEDPGRAVKDDVLALALPHVDADDADSDIDTILAGIDGDATAAEIQEAFGDSGRIGEALALLTPWMAKHNVNASNNAIVRNVNGYLDKFTQRSWENREAIEQLLTDGVEKTETKTGARGHEYDSTYFEDIFSDAEAAELRSNWADSFLAVSNEDIGGGWDSLPESMREAVHHDDGFMSGRPGHEFRDVAEFLTQGNSDLPPGDGLATELANSVTHSLYNNYTQSGPPGDSEWTWSGPPGEDILGDTLELVSRNHEATTALFTGDAETTGFDGHLPGDHDPGEFVHKVFNHRWDDDGADAANLVSWMHDAHGPDSPGAHDRNLADTAYQALTTELTNVEDDNFKDLMGTQNNWGHEGESAIQINPVLGNALVDATSDQLDQLARAPGDVDGTSPLSEADRVRLFTLLGSGDEAPSGANTPADRLGAAVLGWQDDNISAWARGDDPEGTIRDLADRNARLATYLDAGLINAASEQGYDQRAAEAQREEHIKTSLGILSSVAGLGPTGSGAIAGSANSVLSSVINGGHIPNPSADLTPDWTAQGSHLTTTNSLQIVSALEDSGHLDRSDIPDELLDPAGKSDAQIADAFETLLDDPENGVFAGHDVAGRYKGEVEASYDSDLGNISLRGKDDNRVDEFLTNPNWPN